MAVLVCIPTNSVRGFLFLHTPWWLHPIFKLPRGTQPPVNSLAYVRPSSSQNSKGLRCSVSGTGHRDQVCLSHQGSQRGWSSRSSEKKKKGLISNPSWDIAGLQFSDLWVPSSGFVHMQVSMGNHFRLHPSLFTRVSLIFKETNVLINSDPVRHSRKMSPWLSPLCYLEVPTMSGSNPG